MISKGNAAKLAREAVRDFLVGLAIFGGLFLMLGAEPSKAVLFDSSWFSHPAHTLTQPHLSGPAAIGALEQTRMAAEHVFVSPFDRLGTERSFVLLGLAIAFASAFAFNLGLWRHLGRTPVRQTRRKHR